MGKLLPILLLILGVGAGIGAGIFLKPPASVDDEMVNPCGDLKEMKDHPSQTPAKTAPENVEYVKLNNQFVVPVVSDAKVSSMVIVALSIEVAVGQREEVYSREPKLRDAFLQVMFDHANIGGFTGAFTSSENLDVLRRALRETGRGLFGDLILDVLITDIARQDV